MCMDPMTMLAVGGSITGAAGSLMKGFASSSADRAGAVQAGIPAQAAQANSQMALDYGEGRVAQIDQRVDQSIGRARAGAGAGNLAANMGSPLAVQMMDAQQGNTDRQLALAGALNASAGQAFTASSAWSRSAQDTQAAGLDQIAGFLGAGTALMRGIGGIKGFGGQGLPQAGAAF